MLTDYRVKAYENVNRQFNGEKYGMDAGARVVGIASAMGGCHPPEALNDIAAYTANRNEMFINIFAIERLEEFSGTNSLDNQQY